MPDKLKKWRTCLPKESGFIKRMANMFKIMADNNGGQKLLKNDRQQKY